jgi:TPR repeat protein
VTALHFLFFPPQDEQRGCRAARQHHNISAHIISAETTTCGLSPPHIHCIRMAPSQTFRAQLAKAEKGETEAQVFVFDCYYFGDKEDVTRDLALAFKFCRMAAEGGHTAFQFNLGIFLRYGRRGRA